MYSEKEVLESLNILNIKPDHNLEENEIKKAYLKLAKIYHPDTCICEEYKDGVMFSKLNSSYDYLKNNLDYANEVIYNRLNPSNKKHNYYNDDNAYYNYNEYNNFNNYKYYYSNNDIKIEDKLHPNLISSIFSLIIPVFGFINYFLFRKVFKKNARFYLMLSIIGILINILPYFIL